MNTVIRCLLFFLSSIVLCDNVLAEQPSTDNSVRTWNFRAFLDDGEIGYHHFTLSQRGEDRTLNSEARFKVKLWFINAYHYNHNATEHWHGNCANNTCIEY